MTQARANGDQCDRVRTAIRAAVDPCKFHFAKGFAPEFREDFREEPCWELFLGHALDETKTRQRIAFRTWGLVLPESAEPLLAVRWSEELGEIHVTRGILSHAAESYESSPGIIETRETIRRLRELVGSIREVDSLPESALTGQISELLLLAVVGLSRLPLASVEAPMTEFSFGQMAYRASQTGATIDAPKLALDRVKWLEWLIRTTPPESVAAVAPPYAESLGGWEQFATDFREMYNGLSLSPWTDFVEKSILWLRQVDPGRERFRFISQLVQLIRRHLNAYDLVTFHHFGANYPDALVIEEFLRELLLTDGESTDPEVQRGIGSAAAVGIEYFDHLVPDLPISQGESQRVMPAEYPEVPQEQITTPYARSRRLFQSSKLLEHPALLRCIQQLDGILPAKELGLCVFVDRPLGLRKLPGEPDQTWLGSHLLFSRTLAERRLRKLARSRSKLLDAGLIERWEKQLNDFSAAGIALDRRDAVARPAVASLQDAFMVSDDFVVIRTTRRSIAELCSQYDFSALEPLFPSSQWHVVLPEVMEGDVVLNLYDGEYRSRLRLKADHSEGTLRVGGREYLRAGFQLLGESTLKLLPRIEGIA